MDFEIIGNIDLPETFAQGSSIRKISRLRKFYGDGRWRKRKGYATVRLSDGTVLKAEIHWYEATGIGKREFKIRASARINRSVLRRIFSHIRGAERGA